MSDFTFSPATKEQARARIALQGPSGSGKTFTALSIAQGLGQRVALIDTERGSASKYADEFQFDTLQMHHFSPLELCGALAAADAAGYDVTIVDSLSHFWMGTGGMLEQVDAAAKRGYGGNSFGGWKEARPMERAMIDALLAASAHVIVTMRSKTEWVLETNDRGRQQPRKVGLRPEQRDGIEYEFDIVGELDLENTLVVSKSRIVDLSGAVVRKPGKEFGEQVAEWLSSGKPATTTREYVDRALAKDATYEELRALHREVQGRGLLGAAVHDDTGEPCSLGDLIVRRGNSVKPAEGAA